MQNEQENPANPQAQPQANWQFHPDTQPASTAQPQPVDHVDWTASEFIAHHKGTSWYAALTGLVMLLAAAVYIITRNVVSTAAVIIVSISFGFLAARKPRELLYSLDAAGIHIGDKFYPYSQFKSFSLVQEDAIESIWLAPLKRFMPIITIYFDPSDQEAIANTLSAFLPLENHQPDAVDKLMHRIRF